MATTLIKVEFNQMFTLTSFIEQLFSHRSSLGGYPDQTL